MSEQPLQPPQINPVGLLVPPDDASSDPPRRYSRAQRLLAGLFVALFLLVTVATTVVSLGRYCLTTDAADTRALRTTSAQ
jgi:hypothetical protein